MTPHTQIHDLSGGGDDGDKHGHKWGCPGSLARCAQPPPPSRAHLRLQPAAGPEQRCFPLTQLGGRLRGAGARSHPRHGGGRVFPARSAPPPGDSLRDGGGEGRRWDAGRGGSAARGSRRRDVTSAPSKAGKLGEEEEEGGQRAPPPSPLPRPAPPGAAGRSPPLPSPERRGAASPHPPPPPPGRLPPPLRPYPSSARLAPRTAPPSRRRR